MSNTGVIDNFLSVFSQYIDSGFGLVHGEVAFIASTLLVIDVTLAALFWTFEGAGENEIIARLIKKTLFVGAFAYLISNWNGLAAIIFNSFAGLGLKAAGSGFSMTDLLRPGKLAQTGLDAGAPLMAAASDLMGITSFFENFMQIICLVVAYLLVVLAFFILAIQMFVTLIEFKLTTLAGFVLIPFGLFGKSAFMAEKVLGNVISSGIKVLVLAVVVGIGSTLFDTFVQTYSGTSPSIEDAMATVLAALTLLGLGIFGPGIANGLVSGGPQMGAGAAVGTGLAAGGAAMAAFGGLGMMARGAAAAVGAAGNAAAGGAAIAGGASNAYTLGAAGKSGAAAIASGIGNVAKAGASAAMSPLQKSVQSAASRMKSSFQSGVQATTPQATPPAGATSGPASAGASGTSGSATNAAPEWAEKMKRDQAVQNGVNALTHTIKSSDGGGAGHSVNLKEGE